MTKSDLIVLLAQTSQISRVKAEAVVDTFFQSICRGLVEDKRIEIRGFGSFTNKLYQPYQGRNPMTAESVSVPQKKIPFFKSSKALKKSLNK